MIDTNNFSNVLLRWTIGNQDTTSLKDFGENQKFKDFIWLSKLSILSFQKFFPGAEFVVLYNGGNFREFMFLFDQSDPQLFQPVRCINQLDLIQEIGNPYNFAPRGVWWKWVPFRLDISKHEIAIDTDILCISEPKTWYKWLRSHEQILVAPERFKKISSATCGDFHQHPVLKNKNSLNCGVVGQRQGCDHSDRFFNVTSDVKIGSSHNSLFITEQGAINVWIRSLEREGVNVFVLDFNKNAWIRDFIYFIHRGIPVETVHAVTWYKKIVKQLDEAFLCKILDDNYDYTAFLSDVLRLSTNIDKLSKFTIIRQLGNLEDMGSEFLLSQN